MALVGFKPLPLHAGELSSPPLLRSSRSSQDLDTDKLHTLHELSDGSADNLHVFFFLR